MKPKKHNRSDRRVWVLWDTKNNQFVRIGNTDVIAVTRRHNKIHADYIWVRFENLDPDAH